MMRYQKIMNEQSFTSRRFHFIVDAFDCDVSLLSNQVFLEKLVRQIAKLLDMKILKGPEVAVGIPENPGLSAFAIIDFSHISIHTFTNSKEFCLDIFSCKAFDYKKLEKFVKHTFGLTDKQIYKSIVRYDQLNIERGEEIFSSKQYLDEYYNKLNKENIALLDWYKTIYSEMGKKDALLEIGRVPIIHQLISASDKVKNITFTNYSQKNLDELAGWAKNNSSFWDKFIEYSLKIELGKNITKKEIGTRKEDISNKLKKFILLDVSQKSDRLVNKFDIVQSNFCLESSTDDISEYKRMLKNAFCYLKPGGTFLMATLEGAMAYKVGKKYFPAIYLDKELMKKYLLEAGFKVEKIKKVFSENSDSSKYHGLLFIKAVKKN